MIEYEVLSLAEAQKMVDAVLAYVRDGGHRGIAAVVVDKRGRIITGARTDGMAPRYWDAAHRKAYTAAVFERDTAGLIDFWAAQEKQGHRAAHDWNDPMLTTLAGGYVICHGSRGGPFGGFDVVGGVGVAGGSRGDYSDDAIAEVAVQALGEGFRHRRGWD